MFQYLLNVPTRADPEQCCWGGGGGGGGGARTFGGGGGASSTARSAVERVRPRHREALAKGSGGAKIGLLES